MGVGNVTEGTDIDVDLAEMERMVSDLGNLYNTEFKNSGSKKLNLNRDFTLTIWPWGTYLTIQNLTLFVKWEYNGDYLIRWFWGLNEVLLQNAYCRACGDWSIR